MIHLCLQFQYYNSKFLADVKSFGTSPEALLSRNANLKVVALPPAKAGRVPDYKNKKRRPFSFQAFR
ncbi:MAG: hypothetical protein ABIK23_08025, partial [candidate division WOR-3 bacterium]